MAITFDTHQFIKTLEEAGFLEPQAEALAKAFAYAQGQAELATKTDLREMESRLDLKFLALENRLIKWGIYLALGQTAAITALIKLL